MYTCVNKTLNQIQFHNVKSRKKKYKDLVCQNCFSLDVETSSGYLKDGDIIEFDKTKPLEFWEQYQKVGIVYIWQVAIDDNVFYGRTVDDLILFFDDLEEINPHIKIFFVHNLGFEFQAIIREYFTIEKMFARKERHPLVFQLSDYNIEFRCSYQLTNLSLDNCVKEYHLNTFKLDTLEYIKIRTPLTTLSDEELQYCFNDVLIVNEVIDKFKTEYGRIENIPLTQTGEIRIEIKKCMKDDYKWWKLCKSLNDLSFNDYLEMLILLTGGSVHANRLYAGRLIHDHIKCKDYSSDYPFQMVKNKFPMSKFVVTDYDKKYEDSNKYSYIIRVKFEHMICCKYNEYLSISKAITISKPLDDNGKLVECDSCEYVLTNLDFDIVQQCYKWDSIEIVSFKYAINDYLPNNIVNLILELYKDKTTLKGIAEQSDLYLKKKQKINSCYGMSVTKIYNDVVSFGDEWQVEHFNEEIYNRLKAENEKKYQPAVLPFQVGIWVTAYARHMLWSQIIPNDDLILYYDTDSYYYIDDSVQATIDQYNNTIPQIHKDIIDRLNIDNSYLSPLDNKGICHPLGILDHDGDYSQGVFLGAKRYALNKIIATGDNFIMTKIKQTVAGVRKGSVTVLDNDLNNFKDGLVYNYDDSQKLIMTYQEKQPQGITWNKGCYDEYVSNNVFSCNLMPTHFTLSITDNYKKLLDKIYADNGGFFDAKKLYK